MSHQRKPAVLPKVMPVRINHNRPLTDMEWLNALLTGMLFSSSVTFVPVYLASALEEADAPQPWITLVDGIAFAGLAVASMFFTATFAMLIKVQSRQWSFADGMALFALMQFSSLILGLDFALHQQWRYSAPFFGLNLSMSEFVAGRFWRRVSKAVHPVFECCFKVRPHTKALAIVPSWFVGDDEGELGREALAQGL